MSELRAALETPGFEETKRTIERDLTTLAEVFPLQCNAISQPYGWYWEAGTQIKVPGASGSL